MVESGSAEKDWIHPLLRDLNQHFVDISQHALGAADISKTCSLRGLEDTERTP